MPINHLFTSRHQEMFSILFGLFIVLSNLWDLRLLKAKGFYGQKCCRPTLCSLIPRRSIDDASLSELKDVASMSVGQLRPNSRITPRVLTPNPEDYGSN